MAVIPVSVVGNRNATFRFLECPICHNPVWNKGIWNGGPEPSWYRASCDGVVEGRGIPHPRIFWIPPDGWNNRAKRNAFREVMSAD